MAEETLGATTDEGQGTPQAPSDAQGTPTEPQGTTTPPAITPQEPQGESPEAKIARLEAEAQQARTLQAQADRRAKRERAARVRAERLALRGESPSDEQDDDTVMQPQAPQRNLEAERAKAERLMVQKAYSDPKYRAVVDADPTLKRLLEQNPLALVNNPVDAQDAADQLEDMLEERIAQSTPSAPRTVAPASQVPSAAPAAPSTPGVTNPVMPPSSPKHEESMRSGDFSNAVSQKMADPSQWNKPAVE